MKAIILAAGKATRLLPLTKNTPQCMLKIGKKTILENQIILLRKAGIKDVTVITGHLAEQVEKFCRKNRIKTLFNPFYAVSGMALTLWLAKDEIKNGFMVLYSDILFDPGIVKGLLKTKGDISLAIKKNGLREEAEKVIEQNGRIIGLTKSMKKRENGEFIGVAKFSSRGAKKLTEEVDKMAKDSLSISVIDVINKLIKSKENVTAYDIKNAMFIDMDFPEDLKRAQRGIR